MTESDLKTLENKIRDLPIEKATNVKPEDLGLTSTELDQYIKDSDNLLIGKTSEGTYFKRFWINEYIKNSVYIIDPQKFVQNNGANSVVYAVRHNEYSDDSYNIDNSKWKPLTDNITDIITKNRPK